MRTIAVIIGDFGSLWSALPIIAYGSAHTFLFVDRRTPQDERQRYLDDLVGPNDTVDLFYADSGAIPAYPA